MTLTELERNQQHRYSSHTQERLAEMLHQQGIQEVFVERVIEGAVGRIRAIGSCKSNVHTLITGSLHLVGGVLHVLRYEDR